MTMKSFPTGKLVDAIPGLFLTTLSIPLSIYLAPHLHSWWALLGTYVSTGILTATMLIAVDGTVSDSLYFCARHPKLFAVFFVALWLLGPLFPISSAIALTVGVWAGTALDLFYEYRTSGREIREHAEDVNAPPLGCANCGAVLGDDAFEGNACYDGEAVCSKLCDEQISEFGCPFVYFNAAGIVCYRDTRHPNEPAKWTKPAP